MCAGVNPALQTKDVPPGEAQCIHAYIMHVRIRYSVWRLPDKMHSRVSDT
jgi:hypothetical protein